MLRYSITSFILTHKNNCTLSICPVTITVLNLPAGSIEGKYVINGTFSFHVTFVTHLNPLPQPSCRSWSTMEPQRYRIRGGHDDPRHWYKAAGIIKWLRSSSYIRTAIIIILISHIIFLSWAKYECFYFFLFFFACGNCSEIHLIVTIHIEY